MPRTRRGSRIEFRAATVDDIRSIDVSASEVILPTAVYLAADQWNGLSRRLKHRSTCSPPTSGIMVTPASPNGDVILAGKDARGLPLVPIPIGSDTIRLIGASEFEFLGREAVFEDNQLRWPIEWGGIPTASRVACQAEYVDICGDIELICKRYDCRNCVLRSFEFFGTVLLSCTCEEVLGIT